MEVSSKTDIEEQKQALKIAGTDSFIIMAARRFDTGAKKRLLFVSVSSPVRAQQAPDAAEEEEEEEDGRDDGTAARGNWSGVEQPGNDGAQGIGLEDLEVVLDGVGRCDVVDVVLLLLSGEGGAMDEVGAFGVVRRVAEWFVGGRVSVLVASARGLERLVQVARALPHVAVVGKAGDEESVVRMHERARWRGPVVVGVHICTPMRLTLLTADHEEEEDEDTVDLQLDDRVPWRLIVRKRIEDMAPLLPLLDTQLDVAIEGVDAAKAIEMLSEASWLAEFVPYELPYGANFCCWRDVVLGQQQQQQQQQGQVAPSALAAAKGPFVVLHSANGTLHAQRVLNERDVTSCDTVSLFWNPQLSSSSKGVSLANAVAQLNDLPVFGADARAISALQAEQFRSDHIQAPLPTVPAPKLTVRRPSVPATTTTSEYDRTWLLSTSLEPSSAVSPKWQGRLRRHQHWREKNLPISKLPRREHGLVVRLFLFILKIIGNTN